MESSFPHNLRDISDDEIQNGLLSLKILKASKAKKDNSSGENLREQKINFVKVQSRDSRALAEIRTCTEHSIICIERHQVALLSTQKLLDVGRIKSESMSVAYEELMASSGGFVCLCEYLEEEPLYLGISGMRLQLCTY